MQNTEPLSGVLLKSEMVIRDLRKAIKSRDQFLSIASHELRTPLTSLTLQLQLIQRSLASELGSLTSPQKLKQGIDICFKQTQRITRLVNDLLDISRIQAGVLNFTFEEVDLAELLRQCLEKNREQAKLSRCELKLNAPKSLWATCDRIRIEQVIDNLLSNALKYGAGRAIEVSLLADGDMAKMIFRDYGIGIDKNNHEIIFERFERAVDPKSVSGLGLGLFIVRQILNAHKGKIFVDSELDRGATFMVSLPLHSGLKTFDRSEKELS